MTLPKMAAAVLLVLPASVVPAVAQDAGAGEKVFKTQCTACHSVAPNRNGIGPSLHEVVGRAAGTAPNYQYSAANKNSGLTWDDATLDRYLKAPQQVVPGTKMTYAGVKNDTQRTDLIAYLGTLK